MNYGQQMTFPNYQQNYPQYPQNYPNYPGQGAQNYQQYPQNAPQMNAANQQPQIQNSGFVSVRSMAEAQNYPVAPGNSVTFRDENAPYVYEKTMGFSQLDRPIFKRYRLVEEQDDVVSENQAEINVQNQQGQNVPPYVLKEEIAPIRDAVGTLQREVSELKDKVSTPETVSAPKKTTSRAKKDEKGADEQ